MKTEAQKAAQRRYQAKNIELVAFEVRKGKSAAYTEAAAALGIGKMEMLRRAVDEFIARHVGTAEHVAEMSAQSAEPTEIGASGEGIPITFDGVDHTAQIQPVFGNVCTIGPAPNAASNRITAADKRLVDAVNALSPESKKALLKFLKTLQA